VNDAISQADDFAPLNLGALALKFSGQAIGGFADDSRLRTTESMVLSSVMKLSCSSPAT
jgi:hypothetical protein